MLKHVFYLHSQTCYISALKVIKHKKISNDQVILLISRNTPLFRNKYQSFHIYPILDNWPFYTQKEIFKSQNAGKKTSQEIENFLDKKELRLEMRTNWNTLDGASQKSFSPYLINRWLSMNPDYIEIVDMFQQYTIGPLSKKHVYQLYLDFLPKAKMFAKYIKGKKMNKYNKSLVKIVANHYQVSYLEAEQYIEFMGKVEMTELLKKYGKQEKEIKVLLK